jgi:hypothetical protein
MAYKLGSKWTGIAGTNLGEGTCLNDAFKHFRAQGYPNPNHDNRYKIYWGIIESQKNYTGRSPLFKEI